MNSTSKSQNISVVGGVVILLTLVTAAIHFYLVPDEFSKGATGYGTAFILTGAGYLLAMALAFVPRSPFHVPGGLAIAGIATAAIVAYLSLGYFDTLGWVTKGIELALIVAVAVHLIQKRHLAA